MLLCERRTGRQENGAPFVLTMERAGDELGGNERLSGVGGQHNDGISRLGRRKRRALVIVRPRRGVPLLHALKQSIGALRGAELYPVCVEYLTDM